MLSFFYLIFVFLVIISFVEAKVSYTTSGNWTYYDPKSYECKHFLCSKNNLGYKADIPGFKLYDNETACQALYDKGIRLINFYGDSYIRQIYAALLITLSGDYHSGAIKKEGNFDKCVYHFQFSEKKCGLAQINRKPTVCNGLVELDPLLSLFEHITECQNRPGSINIFSAGNHKLSRFGRYGVNDYVAYSSHYNKFVCNEIRSNPQFNGSYSMPCSTWWISTHARVAYYFEDEHPSNVSDFNHGMRAFFDSSKCGTVHTIDVFNMTKTLVDHFVEESKSMSYDSVHWGMEVNLWKAQVILNALLSN